MALPELPNGNGNGARKLPVVRYEITFGSLLNLCVGIITLAAVLVTVTWTIGGIRSDVEVLKAQMQIALGRLGVEVPPSMAAPREREAQRIQ